MIHDTDTFKGWVPDDYLDESVPGMRARPDDWLKSYGDVLMIDPNDEDGEAIRDEPKTAVREGGCVGFSGLTEFEPVRVRWTGPGPRDFLPLSPVPAAATCFWRKGDMDTFATSLTEFVDQYCEIDGLEVGETIEVDCYDWTSVTFELRGGTLVRLEAAETHA